MQPIQKLRAYAKVRTFSCSFDGRNCTAHEIFPFYPQRSESERRISNSWELRSELWKSSQAQPHFIVSVKIE